MGASVASCARVERPAPSSIEQGEDLQAFDRALLAQAGDMGSHGFLLISWMLSLSGLL